MAMATLHDLPMLDARRPFLDSICTTVTVSRVVFDGVLGVIPGTTVYIF